MLEAAKQSKVKKADKKTLEHLEKAYKAYPEGSHAEDIKNTLDGVRQMQQKTLEQAQAAAEAQASADTPANTVQE